jgi:HSP20 family protein
MFLTRYEPNRLFNQLSNEFFNMNEKPVYNREERAVSDENVDWVPKVDVKEEKDKFVIFAEIPGIDPKDIEVTMEKGILTISGHREAEKKSEQDGYQRIERSSGRFYRRFSMPEAVDESKISAKGKHGVLEIVIPKVEDVLPRKITIQA